MNNQLNFECHFLFVISNERQVMNEKIIVNQLNKKQDDDKLPIHHLNIHKLKREQFQVHLQIQLFLLKVEQYLLYLQHIINNL